MTASYTPLRYPGGKTKMGPFLAELFRANKLVGSEYAEPYAGGGGAALFMLFRGYAKRILLNDIDPAVASFWRAVTNHSERFARVIEAIPLTVKEWDRQRLGYASPGITFDRGFAFFYLNRTNRSGIMNGGIIGGRAQSGTWRIDARFNRTQLASQVRAIGAMSKQITVTRSDALDFMDSLPRPRMARVFTYLDPPYYGAGQHLYLNSYDAADHQQIARRLRTFRQPWLLTYDDCPEIRALYPGFNVSSSELSYSAREVRRGKEIVVMSPSLSWPKPRRATRSRGRLGFELVQGAP